MLINDNDFANKEMIYSRPGFMPFNKNVLNRHSIFKYAKKTLQSTVGENIGEDARDGLKQKVILLVESM